MSSNGANGTLSTKCLITVSAGISTTTLTTSDNIVVGAGKKIFVDRSANANNKLALYDNGTGSTTAFYGFGIGNATLMYNVDGSGGNHIFYHVAATELLKISDTAITASKPITLTTTSSGYLTLRQRLIYTTTRKYL